MADTREIHENTPSTEITIKVPLKTMRAVGREITDYWNRKANDAAENTEPSKEQR